MTDFDSIWRTQDEIRTVVNAVLGECIWNLAYDESRSAIKRFLQLRKLIEEDVHPLPLLVAPFVGTDSEGVEGASEEVHLRLAVLHRTGPEVFLAVLGLAPPFPALVAFRMPDPVGFPVLGAPLHFPVIGCLLVFDSYKHLVAHAGKGLHEVPVQILKHMEAVER